MGVRVILGALPSPPSVISAEVLRGLRAPDGRRPCRDGLGRALRWIGDREIPIEQALEEAKNVLLSSNIEWGRRALGISDSSDGYGHGYCSSYGYGYDDGSGYGYGGYGDGYGCDYGSGCGYSYGSGGSGHGSGSGEGSGYGDDYGSSYGSGYGSGYAGYGYAGYDYGYAGYGEEI